jgi:hypothetical protein
VSGQANLNFHFFLCNNTTFRPEKKKLKKKKKKKKEKESEDELSYFLRSILCSICLRSVLLSANSFCDLFWKIVLVMGYVQKLGWITDV